MPKRPLTVQNKTSENDDVHRIVTRSSAKRKASLGMNDENQNKKSKKSEADIENVDPKKVIKIEQINIKEESEEKEEEGDDNEIDDGAVDYPASAQIFKANSIEHPTNKQYVIFQNDSDESIVVSKTALYWSSRYIRIIPHVYPDAYGLYIHNDFSCYGELEILENCLLDLAKAIFVVHQGFLARMNLERKPKEKVNYVLGFRRCEALTYLLERVESIAGIDDGERFNEVMRLVGACYITILRGLLPKKIFEKKLHRDEQLIKELTKISKKIPNFKEVLERTMITGRNFLQIGDTYSSYTSIINNVYRNWIFQMEEQTIDPNSTAPSGKESLWEAMKQAVHIEKHGIESGGKESFDFLKELRIYHQNNNMGGDSHDLRKWPKLEREKYSLDRHDYFDEFWS